MNQNLITIENYVLKCRLNHKLNLKFITKHSKGRVACNPKRFAAIVMRYTDPKISVLIFKSGKFICTGAKTENQAIFIITDVTTFLKGIGYTHAYILEFKTENIVCTARLGVG